MKIREIRPDDIQVIGDMYNQLAYYIRDNSEDIYFDFNELDSGKIEAVLKESIGNKNILVSVAENNNRIFGFITGEIKSNFLPISSIKEVGYIQAAFVLPEFRGKGIMKSLMKSVDHFFKKRGIRYCELNVLTANIGARNAWEKLGFKTFREQMRREI